MENSKERGLEKQEERKFALYCRRMRWKCIKLTTVGSYGETGHVDRMVLAPMHKILFFEFKRPGESADMIQIVRHNELVLMGFKVYVVYSAKEAIKLCLDEIRPKTIPKGIYKVRR